MIIAGNSHVSTFRRGLTLPDRASEKVGVHWVGALTIPQFREGHPSAAKVRRLFAAEPGWKFLCVGNHDVMALAQALALTGSVSDFHRVLGMAREVFSELNAQGRFGWIVSMQQVEPTMGLPAASVLEIARLFNRELGGWCRSAGIPVIDPSGEYALADGSAKPEWLQPDGKHLKPEAARFFLEEIGRQTGERVEMERGPGSSGGNRAIRHEVESFSSLVAEELGFPGTGPDSLPGGDLEAAILGEINRRLMERGLESIGADSDFVADGLLDSLELVEVYDFASSKLGGGIDFDVDLRSLPTARRLASFLQSKSASAGKPGEGTLGRGPSRADFLLCLDSESEIGREAALAADRRIATMGPENHRRLLELVETVFAGVRPPYGVYYFWLALLEAGAGRYRQALALAEDAKRCHWVFHPPRLDRYSEEWREREAGTQIQIRRDAASFQAGPASWDAPVPEDSIRIVMNPSQPSRNAAAAADAVRKGEGLFAEGRLEEAKEAFWEALEANGMDDAVFNDLGVVFWKQGNTKDALGHFHLAWGMNPANADVAFNLSDILKSLNRKDEAEQVLRIHQGLVGKGSGKGA